MPLNKTYRQVLDQSDSVELVLNIPSFAGGENTVGQDQELKSNEARTIENWDSDSLGGMIRSKGFTIIASDTRFGIDTYTLLNIHANTNFSDSSTNGFSPTLVNTPTIDSASKKFGAASGKFVAASSQYVTYPDNICWAFHDFSIDYWIKFDSTGTNYRVCGQYVDANNRWLLLASDTYIYFQIIKAGVSSSYENTFASIGTTNYVHFEVTRSGSTFYIFKNGTPLTVTVTNSYGSAQIADLASVLYVGSDGSGVYLNAHLDEFRISSIARHTASFTPSTVEYSNVYSTAVDGVLHHYEGTNTRNYIIIGGDVTYINSSSLTQIDTSKFTSGILTHSLSSGGYAFFTNTTDNLKFTTIAGTTAAPTGVPASARSRIYYHKSRLIAEGGGVTLYGSRVGSGNWTASADTWTASGDAWSIDLPDLTQGCAPGFPSGGQITVFTKFGAYAITGMPNVAQNYILGSHGCSQPLSIQLGAEGLYLFSLYPTLGIFLWDGSTWTNLTVNETWVNQVSLTNRCFGIYSENKYRFFYNDNTSGQTYPNVCRIYDARFGRWMNRTINTSVADTFGIPFLLTKTNNELYVASSQGNNIYQLEDTSNSDNTYSTIANYTTKDFTSLDFGLPRDEVRMKLLKVTVSFYGTIGTFSLQWNVDRGLHSGSQVFDLTASGDLLNTTFTMNNSYIISGTSIKDKTVTKSFDNSAVGRRFNFQLLNQGTGERVKIKKIKIVSIALEEA